MATELAPLPAAATRTVLSYFDAFAPAPPWDDLVEWPPDVFALANLVLDHTEAYRFVVAPPPGRTWPHLPDWDRQVRLSARAWRETGPPPLVEHLWDVVTRQRDVPLERVRSGSAWQLVLALLTLHAIADEACAEVTNAESRTADATFEAGAWAQLQHRGSLSRLSATRVRIVPKALLSARGITIRSLSRYLALCYESVEVRWRGIEPGVQGARRDYNIVLVPWPLSVRADDFREARSSALRNMDPELFGFFEFAPQPGLDVELVDALLQAAADAAGPVDAVVLPEAAVPPDAIPHLERALDRHDTTFLIAGVHQRPGPATQGRNYLHFGVRTPNGWDGYEQDKHHRWCLDERQIRQYHLSRSLQPSKLWWESIDIRERTLHVIDIGGGTTTTPLVCEDLARLDEVADLIRRIGPSLVVAVLLDGPQLSSRWPCRYASVIADDPGSAVITLTSYGMVARCRPPGKQRSRVVAHWNDGDNLREIELAPGAAAVLITTSTRRETVWTADGRRHLDVPRLKLAGVRQLRPSRPTTRGAAL